VIITHILNPNQNDPIESRLFLKINTIKTPIRKKRILWDQYHNINYPPAYVHHKN
jgi:membrane-bound transcription factor site-1 protease